MAKDEKFLIDFIESMKTAKEVINSNSTDVVEISSEFLNERTKFLAWKESKKFPAVIRLGIDKKINERILYTPQTLNPYFLPDIEIGSVIKFWSCEKGGKRNFLLYEFRVSNFDEDEIVAQISDFFAIGLNIFKQSEERCTIKVCDGTPDEVQYQVEEGKLIQNNSISAYENFFKMTLLAVLFAHIKKVKHQRPLLAFMLVLIVVSIIGGTRLGTLVRNEKVNTIETQDSIQAQVLNSNLPQVNNPMILVPAYYSDKDLQSTPVETYSNLGSSENKSSKPEKSISREKPKVREMAKSDNLIGKNNEELICQQLQETTTKIQENQIQLESINNEIARTKVVYEKEQLQIKRQKLENDKSELLKNFLIAVNAIKNQDNNSQFDLQKTMDFQEDATVQEDILETSSLNEEYSYERLYGRNNCVKIDKNLGSVMLCGGPKSLSYEK